MLDLPIFRVYTISSINIKGAVGNVGDFMQSIQKYEEQVMREIMSFPPDKLPQVARLLRLLRQDFAAGGKVKVSSKKTSWETELASFCGTVSSTDDFISRKADEKALER
jgi:hypothetical protein